MPTHVLLTLADTQSFAQSCAPAIARARGVLLQGDLGSGKTTFAQALGATFGVKRFIASPTFTLVNVYDLPEEYFGIRRFVHADFYRLASVSEQEWCELGLETYAQEPDTLICIEWPERLLFSLAWPRFVFEVQDQIHTILSPFSFP